MKTPPYRRMRIPRLPAFAFEGMRVKALVQKRETEKIVAYHIRFPKRMRIPRSYHKLAHEVIVVLAGRGTALLNGKAFPIGKGDALFIRPGTWHSFSTKDSPLEVLSFLAPRVDAVTDIYYK